jgi:hypothetical protein
MAMVAMVMVTEEMAAEMGVEVNEDLKIILREF